MCIFYTYYLTNCSIKNFGPKSLQETGSESKPTPEPKPPAVSKPPAQAKTVEARTVALHQNLVQLSKTTIHFTIKAGEQLSLKQNVYRVSR